MLVHHDPIIAPTCGYKIIYNLVKKQAHLLMQYKNKGNNNATDNDHVRST